MLEEPQLSHFAVLIFLTFALAYISWRFIETPFRNGLLPGKQFWFVLTGFALILIILVLVVRKNEGIPSRLNTEVRQAIEGTQDKSATWAKCLFDEKLDAQLKNGCVEGKHSNVTAVLLGDSHAYALAQTLGREFEARDMGINALTRAACPPTLGVYHTAAGGTTISSKDTCYLFNSKNFNIIRNDSKIQTVIVSARWAHYLEVTPFNNQEGGKEPGDDIVLDVVVNGIKQINSATERKKLLQYQMVKSIQLLLEAGKRVVLVYPVPEVAVDTPKYIAKILFKSGNKNDFLLTTSFDVYKVRNQSSIDTLDSIGDHPRLFRVKPHEIFCNSYVNSRCVADIEKRPLYLDDDHLSNYGAEFVTKAIVKKIF